MVYIKLNLNYLKDFDNQGVIGSISYEQLLLFVDEVV